MRTVRCLLRPVAAAWLLCSMGTVLADEGVARTADLRPAVGVASTTALRAARQDAATAAAQPAAPAAAAKADKNACAETPCGEGGNDGKGCGENGKGCGCGRKGCKEGCGESSCSCGENCGGVEGCNGAGGRSSGNGLLGRLFGGKGSAAGSHRSGAAGGRTVARNGDHAGNSAQSGKGHGSGLNDGSGAGNGQGTAHGGNAGQAGSDAGGLSGHGGRHGHGGQNGSIYHPASPGHWFGGHGAGVCQHCQCNPCRCNGGYGPGFVDYGDKVFQCLFGWAVPSGACGQGLPLVGKYNMVYANQPGYVNPADTRLYSAQGYGMPMTVPLAPTVNHQYNYSSGIPSSRITTIGTWNPMTSPQPLPHQSW